MILLPANHANGREYFGTISASVQLRREPDAVLIFFGRFLSLIRVVRIIRGPITLRFSLGAILETCLALTDPDQLLSTLKFSANFSQGRQ